MGAPHLVKIGLMGVVGRYESPDFTVFPRDTQVICRTPRGLEIGQVLCPIEAADIPAASEKTNDGSAEPNDGSNDSVLPEGEILRRTGSEDEMILERLERHRDKAFNACQKLIGERNLPGILVDVEHLFDGESVFFYFLGEVDPRLESLTSELAATYEAKVRFKKFAETLAKGCGPGCGTSASKCSTGGCSTCALSGGCGSK